VFTHSICIPPRTRNTISFSRPRGFRVSI
jgi:hypothetical protein